MKSCPKLTRDLNDPQKLDRLRAHIECQQPTVNLYQFVGTLTVYRANFEVQNSEDDKGGVTSLGLDNLLLRGARLKDTDYVYGIVVFKKYAMPFKERRISIELYTIGGHDQDALCIPGRIRN